MADDYGTCPTDVYEDERIESLPLALISGFTLVMTLTDDHMLFEGRPRAFARKIGAEAREVEDLFAALEEAHLVRFYDAPGSGGVARRVGVVIDGHKFRGHPERVANPSRRGASLFPLEDGTYIPGRRERGSDVEAPRKERGRSVAHARDQRSVAEHRERSSLPHGREHSSPNAAAVGSAPPEPALGGAGRGATEEQPPTPKAEPSAPNRPPDPGESWDSFAARYPWPDDPGIAVDSWARIAVCAEARVRGMKPLELREALTRERHGPPRTPDPPASEPEVLH